MVLKLLFLTRQFPDPAEQGAEWINGNNTPPSTVTIGLLDFPVMMYACMLSSFVTPFILFTTRAWCSLHITSTASRFLYRTTWALR